jgi:hypothetical protein
MRSNHGLACLDAAKIKLSHDPAPAASGRRLYNRADAKNFQSTTLDGKKSVTEVKFADVSFNRRDRTHSELLLSGHGHAIIIELK